MNIDNIINNVVNKTKNNRSNEEQINTNVMKKKMIGQNMFCDQKRTFDVVSSKWSRMSDMQKAKARVQLPDTDGDRVPNPFDCQPRNTMRQDAFTTEAFTRIQNNLQNKKY